MQLANAIAPLFDDDVSSIQAAIDTYPTIFGNGWNTMMAQRLGFSEYAGDADNDLFGELGRVLQLTETDMTIFHRLLRDVRADQATELSDDELVAPIAEAWYGDPVGDTVAEMATWLRTWATRIRAEDRPTAERCAAMDAINPKYVLRNWMAQLAIDRSEAGDHDGVTELLDLLRHPYDEQPEQHEAFFAKRPEWARERAGCCMLSCSS